MTSEERLKRIAQIIERVDHRCMAADGPVTPTLNEMTQAEISEIYKFASQQADSADGVGLAVLEGVEYLVNNIDCDTITLIRR